MLVTIKIKKFLYLSLKFIHKFIFKIHKWRTSRKGHGMQVHQYTYINIQHKIINIFIQNIEGPEAKRKISLPLIFSD